MTNSPPAALLAAAAARPPEAPSEDRLTTLRDAVRACRDLESIKADLEDRLKQVNIALQSYYYKSLPDLFDELGVPSITIAPEGNSPGVKADAKPYYRAGIAASWPPEKRAEAFSYLTEIGEEDLIKTTVTVAFPRGDHERAVSFASQASEAGLAAIVKEEVHAATLTSFLKESIEKHNTVPDLDKIGGTVGRAVSLKPIKDQ